MTLLGNLYHVGIVVPDIEAAKEHLTDLLGSRGVRYCTSTRTRSGSCTR